MILNSLLPGSGPLNPTQAVRARWDSGGRMLSICRAYTWKRLRILSLSARWSEVAQSNRPKGEFQEVVSGQGG